MSDKIAQMKRLMTEAILERQGRCFVQVVPSAAEETIRLPADFFEQDSCTLALNLATMAPSVDDWGLEVATRFNGQPFTCVVPWSAVVQIFDPEDQAAVLAWLFPVQEDGEEVTEESEQDAARGDSRSSHLRVIK